MKSVKNFKKRIVQDNNLSTRITENSPYSPCSPDTVKKILDITSSAYKLDTKPTNRGALKTDHSIEKKSPIRIPQQYMSRRNGIWRREEAVFGEGMGGRRGGGRREEAKGLGRSREETVRFDGEELESIRDIWRAIEKLEAKKQIRKQISDIKVILNTICQKGLKPEFQQYTQKSTQKAIRVPSIASCSIAPDSHKKQYPVQSLSSSLCSPSSTSSHISPSEFNCSSNSNNLEYRKILYMLDRGSQDNINPVNKGVNSRVAEVISQMSSEEQEQEGQEALLHTDKRAVLRDIVHMLNTKYQKNIRIK